MTTRTDRNQTFDQDGNLVSEEVVVVDTTEETNRSVVEDRITAALATLQQLIDYPAVATVPAGTMTTAQLSDVARAMRTAVQENRVGVQRAATVLRDLVRYVRGDFADIT